MKTFREKYLETECSVHPEDRTPEQKQVRREIRVHGGGTQRAQYPLIKE